MSTIFIFVHGVSCCRSGPNTTSLNFRLFFGPGSMCGLSRMPIGKRTPNCGLKWANSCMHAYSSLVPPSSRCSVDAVTRKQLREAWHAKDGKIQLTRAVALITDVRCLCAATPRFRGEMR